MSIAKKPKQQKVAPRKLNARELTSMRDVMARRAQLVTAMSKYERAVFVPEAARDKDEIREARAKYHECQDAFRASKRDFHRRHGFVPPIATYISRVAEGQEGATATGEGAGGTAEA